MNKPMLVESARRLNGVIARQLGKIAREYGIQTQREFRLAVRIFAIFAGTIIAFAVAILLQIELFFWSVLPFLGLLGAAILEFLVSEPAAKQEYPYETEQILAMLERQLGQRAVEGISDKLGRIIQSFRVCDHSRISGTVHVIVPLAPTPEQRARSGLLQLTNYVGRHGGRKGRITTLEQGIIGRCARTGETEYVNFADNEEYRRRMVEEFGFSKAEAESHTTIARSYMAQPLVLSDSADDTHPTVGVLYFFSTEPQMFPRAAEESNLASNAEDVVQALKIAAIV
jgi:hypothetical protein